MLNETIKGCIEDMREMTEGSLKRNMFYKRWDVYWDNGWLPPDLLELSFLAMRMEIYVNSNEDKRLTELSIKYDL